MKKRWKNICTLALTVLLAAGSAVNVHAEEYTGGDNWSVTFDGKKMNSNFNSSDMADAMQAVQPGDTMTLTVSLQNQDTESTNWYMTIEVLSSL
jgi:opacity protein-like surface antigen